VFKNFFSYLSVIGLLSGLYLPTFFADPLSTSLHYPWPLFGGVAASFFLAGSLASRSPCAGLKPFALFCLGGLFTTLYIFNLPPFLPAGESLKFTGLVYDSKEETNSTLLFVKNQETGRKILVILPSKIPLVGKNLKISGKTLAPSARFLRLIKSEGLRGIVLANDWRESSSGFFYLIFNLREKTLNAIGSLLPEPEASLAAGTLIGKEAIISKELKAQINKVGLTHIVAVSGYNFILITNLIVALLREIFGYLPSLLLSLPFILLYAFLAGFSGAVKRAFIFILLILFGRLQFRNPPALYLLFICFIIAGILNPFTLFSDLSFLLSALAALGILSLGGWLRTQLENQPFLPRLIPQTLAETFSASLFVSPITSFLFGQRFFLGLLVNLLVVPLVPLIMLSTSLALFLSLLTPRLQSLAILIAFPLPRIVLKIITIASQF